ncbi:hypothetical protein CCYA_CCYA18G4592 [Cyanidiococcus yangmingshanensis]|nr:hypothetical protein CCYA_CCYA18G4592 [Cyanidiococcus yangmingshanensis]
MTVQRVLQETSPGGVWRSLAENAIEWETAFASQNPYLVYDEPCTIQHWQLRDLLQVPAYPFGTGRYVYFVSEGALCRLDLKHWRLLAQQAGTGGTRATSRAASARVASRVRDALESLARERYLFLLRRELRGSQRRASAGEARRTRWPEAHDPSHLWVDDENDNEGGEEAAEPFAADERAGFVERRSADAADQRAASLGRDNDASADAYELVGADALPLMLPLSGQEAATAFAGTQIDELLRLELEQSARALTHLVRETPVADSRIRLLRLGGLPSVYERPSGAVRPRVAVQRARSRLAATPELSTESLPRSGISHSAAPLNAQMRQRAGASTGLNRFNLPGRYRPIDLGSMEQEASPGPVRKPYRSQRLQKYSFWPTCLSVMEPYVAVGGQSGQLAVGLLTSTESESSQVDDDGFVESASSEGDSDEEALMSHRLQMEHGRSPRELNNAYRWGRSEYDAVLERSGLWGTVLNHTAGVTDTAHCRTVLCGELNAGVVNNAIVMAPTPADAALAQSWYIDAAACEPPSLSWRRPLPRHLFVCTNDESIKVFDLERVKQRESRSGSNESSSQTTTSQSAVVDQGNRTSVLVPDQVIRCSTNINYAAVSPDAKRLLAVGDSAEVFLFDTRSPSSGGSFYLTATFREANDAGICAAWHPSGLQFAVASQDGLCCVWDARYLGKTLARYTTQSLFPVRSACRSVKFSPAEADVDLLVFAEHQNYVHIACARTYREQVQTICLTDTDTPVDEDGRRSPWHEREEHIAGVGFARQGRSLVIGTELGIREYLVHSRQRHDLGDMLW